MKTYRTNTGKRIRRENYLAVLAGIAVAKWKTARKKAAGSNKGYLRNVSNVLKPLCVAMVDASGRDYGRTWRSNAKGAATLDEGAASTHQTQTITRLQPAALAPSLALKRLLQEIAGLSEKRSHARRLLRCRGFQSL